MSPSSQARQSGHRPARSRIASCTSCAISPATYALPSSHWDVHHRRVATDSSRAETDSGSAARVTSRSCNTSARALITASSGFTVSIVVEKPSRTRVVHRMQGSGALLEVAVLHLRDLPGADEGGADRLEIVAPDAADGMSPETSLVSSICKESEVPARVMLRLNGGFSTTGGELARLVG